MKQIMFFLLIFCTSPILFSAQDPIADEIKRIEISAEIAEMVGPDQALRFGGNIAHKKGLKWEKISSHPDFQRKLARIDSENAKRMKVIVRQIGWPTISEYGKYTARNAWLLVQHMDADIEFQKKVLSMMKDLLSKNEVIRPDYALLYDRVQVNSGKLQLYGSQGECKGNEWQPKPVQSPDQLDERRKEMGLPTMEEYKKMFKDVCF